MPFSDSGFVTEILLGKPRRADELPYVFCGNGACRDCNLLVEGLEDVPSCRIPIVERLSLRTGEGGGGDNALSRQLPAPEPGAPIVTDVAVVGAGDSGAAAAAASLAAGRETVWLDARTVDVAGARARSPVAVVEGRVVVYERGRARPLRARTLVLATGSRDRYSSFAGSTLPGVLPLDLLERYAELGERPGVRFVLLGDAPRLLTLGSRLFSLGAAAVTIVADRRRLEGAAGGHHVEAVRLATGEAIEADTLGVSFRREPSLALAKALGCRTRYDAAARLERVEVDERGASSVAGVFLARRKC